MGEKSILVIGARIGGLAAGCYARMHGYKAAIFEAHNQPGGVCTSWRRKGYTFDGCIHHLAGCDEGSAIGRIWGDLGALPRPILYPEGPRPRGGRGRKGGHGLHRPRAPGGGAWMLGQWVGGAGLPGCAVMGKNAIRAIARRDGGHFVSSTSAGAREGK